MTPARKTKVDFSYAFATPHRVCICLPESSRKCLLDATEHGVTASWSDGDLAQVPLGALKPPRVEWWMDVSAEANGAALPGAWWRRVDNRIPALEYLWRNDEISVQLTAAASSGADVFRFTMSNGGTEPMRVRVLGKMRNLVFNSMWIDPGSQANALLPTAGDRSDRMLVVAACAEKPSALPSRDVVVIDAEIMPGKEARAFFIRPHFAIIDEAPTWLSRDWEGELAAGLETWRRLLEKAPRFHLPDSAVADAYYAGLSDLFVMREPQADGRVAATAGTEIYRSANSGEPCFAAIVLDQAGFHAESEAGMDLVLSFQEENGRWDDYRRWGHDMWALPGFKCLAVREHYLFTRDRDYLSKCFKRMLAHARWAHRERQKTKTAFSAAEGKPLTWGLMPRGMGDCGLMDGDDLYGVFLPHNVWHCFVLKTALWAAMELGLEEETREVAGYCEDALACTLESIERGAIEEQDGSRWIPGVPGKTSGSHWGALNAAAPCGLLDPHHPLIDGTLKLLEGNLSQGGIPRDLGWLAGGLWVSIALDNLSYCHLARGDGDAAAQYLYPTLNHGTPLFSWCEERLPEPGATRTTGDRQHLWTPAIVARFVRDMLLMEDGETLHVCRAAPRWWLGPGNEITIEGAKTHWGTVSYRLWRRGERILALELAIRGELLPKQLVVHAREPDRRGVARLRDIEGGQGEVHDERIVVKVTGATVNMDAELR